MGAAYCVCVCLCVYCTYIPWTIGGGGSEGLSPSEWLPEPQIVLLPRHILAHYTVGLVQLHKLDVQSTITGRRGVTILVQVTDMRETSNLLEFFSSFPYDVLSSTKGIKLITIEKEHESSKVGRCAPHIPA